MHIAFQDGFDDDTAVVFVEGKEIVRCEGLTTRTQIGLARAVERSVEGGVCSVELRLPTRSLTQETELPLSGATYLGVSRERDALTVRIQQEPFGYV